MAGNDSDSFEWGSDGEAEPSSAAASRFLDAAGPSTLGDDSDSFEWDSDCELDAAGPSKLDSNGEEPSTSLVEGYVGMGFPKEIVVKGIKEIGHNDADALLELLLTYKTLGDEAAGNCSTSGFIPWSVENDGNLDLENWDGNGEANGRETNSDSSGDKNFLREMSEKDNKIKSLIDMGFPKDEANMSIIRCGVDAALCVLVDSIYASEAAGNSNYMNLSEHGVTSRGFDSFGGRKKARLVEESKKKMKPGGGLMALPNPMTGFSLPNERLRLVTRTLPKQAIGPPYFYYEIEALAPRSEWMKNSRFLHDIEPEFVDSKYFCAAAGERGYVHNLPVENRSPLLPVAPKTIFQAFPRYQKWWPSWDPRNQLDCLQPRVASPNLIRKIECALLSSSDPPSRTIQKYVMDECRRYNLVWVGKNKVAPLEPEEMEYLLGLPRDHTRGSASTARYRSLGNSFQVDTVGFHLSVLKEIFPNGLNVISLLTGIGAGVVALHRLGIHIKTLVSVDKSEINRRILRSWWDQTHSDSGSLVEIADVKCLTNDEIKSLISRFGHFDLVIGGLEGEEPGLLHNYSRILDTVKSARMRM